jgi:dTDP-4-amino-4,6-dideoxygalactose transaminase
VLNVKLKFLDGWNRKRQQAAALYDRLLVDVPGVVTPARAPYSSHVYHIYAVQVDNRDRVAQALNDKGIGAMVHYPIPLHLQKAYQGLKYSKGDFPVAEKVAGRILSLPMHPYVMRKQIEFVCATLTKAAR